MPFIRNPLGNDLDREILFVGAVVALTAVLVLLQIAPGIDLTTQQTVLTLGAALVGGLVIAWGLGRVWEIVRQEVALRENFKGLEAGADAARKAIRRARETGQIGDDGPSAVELIQYARVFKAQRAALGPIRDQAVRKLLADLRVDG